MKQTAASHPWLTRSHREVSLNVVWQCGSVAGDVGVQRGDSGQVPLSPDKRACEHLQARATFSPRTTGCAAGCSTSSPPSGASACTRAAPRAPLHGAGGALLPKVFAGPDAAILPPWRRWAGPALRTCACSDPRCARCSLDRSAAGAGRLSRSYAALPASVHTFSLSVISRTKGTCTGAGQG